MNRHKACRGRESASRDGRELWRKLQQGKGPVFLAGESTDTAGNAPGLEGSPIEQSAVWI